MDVRGAVAVVTGGASGIGAAAASQLAAAGAQVVVWDVASGGVVCDVSDEAAVDDAMAETIAQAGVPTVLVTAAGVGSFAPLVSLDAGDWDHVVGVNLRGTMLCLRAVARAMVEGGRGGAVVTVSSINGRVVDRGMAAYCVSKAGVDMLTRVAAAELGPYGIRVNAVAPGVTDTPMLSGFKSVPGMVERVVGHTPLRSIGTPDQIADAVMALVATDWVTGQSLVVDGGVTLHSPVDAWGALGVRPGPR